MALARILIDGYSLLHAWPEIAPGRARHSEAARDELIKKLRQYRDASHTPITIVFDGTGSKLPARRQDQVQSTPELEILYSGSGQTADDVIERVAHRLNAYGEALVVTDDYAERDTVINFGGMASSCLNFIQTVESALAELQHDLKRYNRLEKNQFVRPRTGKRH